MTAFAEYVEARAAAVHASWMAAQHANNVRSRISVLTGAELMVPYEQLPDRDKEVDRATVRTVLDDALLLAALHDMFELADPIPARLAQQCRGLLAGEDGQR